MLKLSASVYINAVTPSLLSFDLLDKSSPFKDIRSSNQDNMQAKWDFRSILDVNPDDDRLCVGIAKSAGRRCKNPINIGDRGTAGRLLDEMGRSSKFLSSIEYLERLAGLMLCKGVHNSSSRPHLSQVEEVYMQWKSVVLKEHRRVRKLQVKADLTKMENEVSKVKQNLELVSATFDAKEQPKVCSRNPTEVLLLITDYHRYFRPNPVT